jgi:hypothetical protein
MKDITKMDKFVIFIIFIKIIFIISAIAHVYLTHFGKSKDPKWDKRFVYWKERAEFIFIISMAIILIIVFNPRVPYTEAIDSEMKILLFLFGWILIITAKWGIFFKETKWLHSVQNAFN